MKSIFSNEFFKNNRKKFNSELKNSSTTFLFSKDINLKGDSEYFYICDENLFYLTGLEESNLKFIIYKDSKGNILEYLFIKKLSDIEKIFEGDNINFNEIKKLSGINKKNIYFDNEFENISNNLIKKSKTIYTYQIEKKINKGKNELELYIEKLKLNNKFDCDTNNKFNKKKNKSNNDNNNKKQTSNKLKFESTYYILEKLRLIKSPEEIKALTQAAKISEKAYKLLMKKIKKLSYEQEIEAIFTSIFTKSNSKHSYHPIVASGKKACTLHYIKNNQKLNKTDLVLMDIGAEYKNYKTDITRCIPISGKFTKRQKEIYSAVLDIQKYAISIVKVGIFKKELELKAREYMGKKFIELGLINTYDFELDKKNNFPISIKYCPHGISHFLGLDTHDIGNYSKTFQEGNVITIEPGIYLKSEGIGIRIEDDILIQKNKVKVLTKGIIKEIKDIESYMET